jgi:hypothetical protein
VTYDIVGGKNPDGWYEALLKEQVWHQWVSNGLVKSMDIPSRNTLAHLYVNAKTPSTAKRIGSTTKGLLALQRTHCQKSMKMACRARSARIQNKNYFLVN